MLSNNSIRICVLHEKRPEPDSNKATRACLKKAFCKMCVTICGRFCPDEGVVAGYNNRIRAKYTAKWGVQIAGMIFQTRSSPGLPLFLARKRSFLYVTLVIAVMMSKIRRARLTASIGRSLKEQNFYLSAP